MTTNQLTVQPHAVSTGAIQPDDVDPGDSVYFAPPQDADRDDAAPAPEIPAAFTGLPAIPTVAGLAGSVATAGGVLGATGLPGIVTAVALPGLGTLTAGAVLMARARRARAVAEGRRMPGGRWDRDPAFGGRGRGWDRLSGSRRWGRGAAYAGAAGTGAALRGTGSGLRGTGSVGRTGTVLGSGAATRGAAGGSAGRVPGARTAEQGGSAARRAAARVASRAAALPGVRAARQAAAASPALGRVAAAAGSARGTVAAAARRTAQNPALRQTAAGARDQASAARWKAREATETARARAVEARETARTRTRDARDSRREHRAATAVQRAEKRAKNWAKARRITMRVLASVPVAAVGIVGTALGLVCGMARNTVALFNKDVSFNGSTVTWGWRWAKALWQILNGRMTLGEFERLMGVDDPEDDTDQPEASGAGSSEIENEEGPDVSVFAKECQQVAEAYLRYSPPSMMAVAAEYKGLPGACRNTADALYALAENTSGVYPAEKGTADRIEALADQLTRIAIAADEIYPKFTTLHAEDLRRFDAPRNGFSGERMWNIGGRPGEGEAGMRPSVMETAAEAVATTYSRYAPPSMMAVGREYEGLPTGLEALAQAVGALAANSEANYPVADAVTEMVGNIYRLLVQAAAQASSVTPGFRRDHAADIARHEEPRKSTEAEAMWNV
ncbi:hypothetical protein [Kitasatospora sp. NPDC006786]|uniref:hypothetical protein n=1 Tax=unclassified Kitasatospora TaxID=2633591 RepID=UPI0033FD7A17